MKKLLALSLAVAIGLMFLSVTPSLADGAQKGRIGAEVIVWWPEVMGEVSLKSDLDYLESGDYLKDLEYDKQLNLDSVSTTLDVGLWLNITKRNRFSFYWFMDSRDGKEKLEEDVQWGDYSFKNDADVKTETEVQRYRLLYERSLIRGDRGRIALGMGVAYLDAHAKISGSLTQEAADKLGLSEGAEESEEDRVRVALPVAAGALELRLPLGFGVFAEGSGLAANYGDYEGKYFDVRGGLNWKSRFVFAQGGYQYLLLYGKASDDLEVEYGLAGPFVSAGVKF